MPISLYKVPRCHVQLCSDIHLEDSPMLTFKDIIKPSAPNLCLAGDIGNPYSESYYKFLEECSFAYEDVFIIAGNHEYYNDLGMSVNQCNDQINHVTSKFNNVHFLNKSTFKKNGRLFIGTTLWSHVPESAYLDALAKMNDYKYIPGLTDPAISNELHRDQLSWLTKTLKDNNEPPHNVIVLTHHCPSMIETSHIRFSDDPIRYCYKSELDDVICDSSVSAWMCGHTHFSFSQKRQQTLFCSNQYQSRRYDPRKTFFV